MANVVNIRLFDAKGSSTQHTVRSGDGAAGKPLRLRAADGAVELRDQVPQKDATPLRAKRANKDLLILLGEGDASKPDLILEDFFSSGARCRLLGVDKEGVTREYLPASGNTYERVEGLSNDDVASQVLTGEACAPPTAGQEVAASTATSLSPSTYVLLGLVGLGVVGAAAGGGGSSGSAPPPGGPSGPLPPGTVAVASPTVRLATPSNSGNTADNITNDATPLLQGTGVVGFFVVVRMPGGESITVPVNPDGTWSAQPAAALPDGSNTIEVVQRDNAGNLSSPATLVLVIDTTAPTTTPTLAVASDSGVLGDNITNDTTPTITGTGTGGEAITVTVGGQTLNTTVGSDGTWSVTPTALGNGQQVVSATATDAAGNTGAVGTLSLTIDTTPPAVPTVRSFPTNDLSPVLNGTTGTAAALATGETLTVAVNGATYNVTADATGAWSLDLGTAAPATGTLGTFVNNTSYSVTARVTDAAGNASVDATANELTIDTTPPAAPTVDLLNTDNTAPIITGAGAVLATGEALRVTVNALAYNVTPGSDGTWALNLATATPISGSFAPLTLGTTYSVTATVIDAAGNTASDATSSELILAVQTSDVLVGNAAPNTLQGWGGTDSLYGGAGNDVLEGGEGNDVLVGGSAFARNGSFEAWSGAATGFGGIGASATLSWGSASDGVRGWTFGRFVGATETTPTAYEGGQIGTRATTSNTAAQFVSPLDTNQGGNYVLDLIGSGSAFNAAGQAVQTAPLETYTLTVYYLGASAVDGTPRQLDATGTTGSTLNLYWNNSLITATSSTSTGIAASNADLPTSQGGVWWSRTWTVTGTGSVVNWRLQDGTTTDAFGVQIDRVTLTSNSGNGDDILRGGAGNDQLYGGGGNDTLTGGSGADRFYFSMYGVDNTARHDGADVITDFNVADGDRIVLTDLLDLTAWAFPASAPTGASTSDSTITMADLVNDTSSFGAASNQTITASQVGADTVLTFGNGASITIQGVSLTALGLTAGALNLQTLPSWLVLTGDSFGGGA